MSVKDRKLFKSFFCTLVLQLTTTQFFYFNIQGMVDSQRKYEYKYWTICATS